MLVGDSHNISELNGSRYYYAVYMYNHTRVLFRMNKKAMPAEVKACGKLLDTMLIGPRELEVHL